MRKALSFFVWGIGLVVACGGATSTVGGGGGQDGGSSGSSGSSSGSDSGSKPKLEDLQTCSKAGQCVLDAAGCCGLNCQPDSELIAVRSGTQQDVILATCTDGDPGHVMCPQCARQIEGAKQAFCRDGKCQVVDIPTDTISTCASNDDCILRYAECCQPCNGGSVNQVVAISKSGEGELTIQLCTGSEACDKCLPSFPGTMHAICNQSTGHCEVAGQ